MMNLDSRDFPPLPSQQPSQRPKEALPLSTQLTSHQKRIRTTLNDLPNELLLLILDFLPNYEDPALRRTYPYDPEHERRCWLGNRSQYLATLLPLSSTCHRLHSLVAEKLYSDYDSALASPYLFLRTVISNPNIARLVRSVSFQPDYVYHDGPRRKFRHPTVSDRGIIKSGLKALGLSGWKSWATHCNEGVNQEYILATILMYTTNVKTVDYRRGYGVSVPQWLTLIKSVTSRNPFGQPHDFAHLQSVQIDAQSLGSSQLAPLFRLPSLRHLRLENLEDLNTVEQISGTLPKWSLAPRSSSLEELSLPSCFVHSRNLAAILNACHHLKVFSYKFPNDRSSRIPHHGLDLDPIFIHHPTVYTALRASRSSLEKIEYMPAFCDHCENAADFNYSHRQGPLGSFLDFPRLSSVSGTLGAFVDVRRGPNATLADQLPQAVTNIHVSIGCNVERDCILSLEHLVETFAIHVPKLDMVSIHYLATQDYHSCCLLLNRVLDLFIESTVGCRILRHGTFKDEVVLSDGGRESSDETDSDESSSDEWEEDGE
ncbi:hypothetical protein P154DRAFT_559440 [Amniculicola lignicola CBS 123094]|uniref:F-box domain-containing protein n=1 Tax=Amniculicola lignicola CBS 123094 TaxID=1392246 RepID=A0A6A5X2S5_9PLEO|nr:hypothetical protein P154DRAFT_559440 [Amniculicola lignicola CBS 123094]